MVWKLLYYTQDHKRKRWRTLFIETSEMLASGYGYCDVNFSFEFWRFARTAEIFKKKVARKHVTQTLMETSIDYIYEYGSAKFYLFWRARYYCFFFKGAVAVNGRRKITILKTEKIQSALWQNCFIDSDFTYSGWNRTRKSAHYPLCHLRDTSSYW